MLQPVQEVPIQVTKWFLRLLLQRIAWGGFLAFSSHLPEESGGWLPWGNTQVLVETTSTKPLVSQHAVAPGHAPAGQNHVAVCCAAQNHRTVRAKDKPRNSQLAGAKKNVLRGFPIQLREACVLTP